MRDVRRPAVASSPRGVPSPSPARHLTSVYAPTPFYRPSPPRLPDARPPPDPLRTTWHTTHDVISRREQRIFVFFFFFSSPVSFFYTLWYCTIILFFLSYAPTRVSVTNRVPGRPTSRDDNAPPHTVVTHRRGLAESSFRYAASRRAWPTTSFVVFTAFIVSDTCLRRTEESFLNFRSFTWADFRDFQLWEKK